MFLSYKQTTGSPEEVLTSTKTAPSGSKDSFGDDIVKSQSQTPPPLQIEIACNNNIMGNNCEPDTSNSLDTQSMENCDPSSNSSIYKLSSLRKTSRVSRCESLSEISNIQPKLADQVNEKLKNDNSCTSRFDTMQVAEFNTLYNHTSCGEVKYASGREIKFKSLYLLDHFM